MVSYSCHSVDLINIVRSIVLLTWLLSYEIFSFDRLGYRLMDDFVSIDLSVVL
jgi:hypothetical protein